MIPYKCPITSGQPTSMVKATFLTMCADKRAAGHPACLECRGKKLPEELEFIELNLEENAVAKKSGTCEQCGKEGVSNLVRTHNKECCPSCSVLRSGVKNHIEMVRELIAEFYGPEPSGHQDDALTAAYKVSLQKACTILGQTEEIESIADLARKRMDQITELEALNHNAQAEIKDLHILLKGSMATPQEPPAHTGMALAIEQACAAACQFLLEKNKSYGNSAADPVRVFSKADPLEQINVRLDDKLSRLIRGESYPGDNDEQDLLGYLLLKQAVRIYREEMERLAA